MSAVSSYLLPLNKSSRLVLDTDFGVDIDTIFRTQWSTVKYQFAMVKEQLNEAKSNFEAEVNLANCQIQAERHLELLQRIASESSEARTITTTVLTPRNKSFTGRDTVLQSIHSALNPNATKLEPEYEEEEEEKDEVVEDDDNTRTMKTCVIRGVAGMGKTETALEYTYRYRKSYSHIFWIHAESDTALLESFFDIVRELGLSTEDQSPTAMLRSGLNWLRSSSKTLENTLCTI